MNLHLNPQYVEKIAYGETSNAFVGNRMEDYNISDLCTVLKYHTHVQKTKPNQENTEAYSTSTSNGKKYLQEYKVMERCRKFDNRYELMGCETNLNH